MTAGSVPLGYSAFSAIAMVRARCNEPNLPIDTQVLAFLNAGLEQVQGLVGATRLYASFPTVPNQTVVTLSNDIQDIISASWSTGEPTAQGSLVYPMQQWEQAQFMDYAAGFPAVGFGPPQNYFLFQDYGTGPQGFLPAPPTRQLTSSAGTSAVAQTIFAAVTWVTPNGETTPSAPQSIALTTELQAQIESPPPIANATGYNVYAGTSASALYLQGSGVPGDTGFTIPGTLAATTLAPTSNTASYPSGGFLTAQLYPAAMQGQMNVYYRARPLLYADTSASSYTNMDTLAQEAAILWTCCRVLENRQRGDEAMQIFKPQYDQAVVQIEEKIQKRTTPKAGVVRDVRGRSFPGTPWYWGGGG